MSAVDRLSWQTIGPAQPSRLPREAVALLRAALSAADVGGFLRAAAREDRPVLVLVNDPERSTHTRPALTALAELLANESGRPSLRILVATGTHRFAPPERRSFERGLLAGCDLPVARLDWHDARASASLAELGGVRLNRRVVEHTHLLAVGSVEPHYFAGVTGAHKTLTVGVMSYADIERNHAGALDPAADVFRLAGNPVFDGIAACLRLLIRAGKRICVINQVVRGPHIVAAAAGDPLRTLDALLPTVREVYVHSIARPVDVLRLRVPPPLGRSLYQADKALKNNHRAVRSGGGIVLEAECPDGIGPAGFMDLLRQAPDYAAACRIVSKRGYRLGDHKAVRLRHLTDPRCRNVRVALVSRNVCAADAQTAGMRLFDRPEAALGWLLAELPGPHERGLIVEDAGLVTVAPS